MYILAARVDVYFQLAIDPCFARVRLHEFGIENVQEYIHSRHHLQKKIHGIFMWFDTNLPVRLTVPVSVSSCKVDMYP